MKAGSPDVDPLPPRVPLKFHFPYRPSTLLCSALIFWTVICILSEMFLYPHPFNIVINFTVTTYGPTLGFAVQYLVETFRGTYDSDKTRKKAATICSLWFLLFPMRFIPGWKVEFSWVFLVPLLSGCGGIVMSLYISLRYAADRRAIRLAELVVAPTKEEAPPPAMEAESQPLLASNTQFSIYRPSKMLLVTSMVFAVGSWATETLFVIWELQHRCHWRRISFTIIWELVLIWLYVPLIWIQSYTLKRTILRCAPTLVDEGGIGNYSMDLATIFVGMKPLVILYSATTTQYRALTYAPGIIQSCLVIYIGARYAWSFSKVIPRYARLNRREAGVENAVQATVPEPLQIYGTMTASSSTHSAT
ncbi:hypothetical protein D9619_012170 [Psilocybe cf. subviscida]|uniref:Uncharacterized protein n=1 Tax=Psilocybe cf. subviscida TaxID=2480587 RepID=A0A8H5B7C5_9AGAR|nr:hypothetical protein D9619_012170 [Psilocybe cf. subviscida]